MYSDPAATAHSTMRLSSASCLTTSNVCDGATRRAKRRISLVASSTLSGDHPNFSRRDSGGLVKNRLGDGHIQVALHCEMTEPHGCTAVHEDAHVNISIE